MLTTRYFVPGVNIMLLQCCLEVVSPDVGVDTGELFQPQMGQFT